MWKENTKQQSRWCPAWLVYWTLRYLGRRNTVTLFLLQTADPGKSMPKLKNIYNQRGLKSIFPCRWLLRVLRSLHADCPKQIHSLPVQQMVLFQENPEADRQGRYGGLWRTDTWSQIMRQCFTMAQLSECMTTDKQPRLGMIGLFTLQLQHQTMIFMQNYANIHTYR